MKKDTILITAGDPVGIGPEVIIKALNEIKFSKKTIVIIGSDEVFKYYGKKIKQSFNYHIINSISQIGGCGGIYLLDIPCKFKFPISEKKAGEISFAYIQKATKLIKDGLSAALVTAPVNKSAIQSAGIKFQGHTEYLEEQFLKKTGRCVMMLLYKHFRVALVTNHLPIGKVSKAIDKERILSTIITTISSLKNLFKIKSPDVCVCALNPHAGDNKLFGTEEELIKSVVDRVRKLGFLCDGPLPADIAMLEAKNRNYDAVIAMYHDQALIPLKLIAGYKAVNLTLGLPFIRTSPAHGTAYDIAGKGIAEPDGMKNAIYLAISLSSKI